ncbi:hypothetical protein [Arthrospira platensis]|jgi:hypothetical protein|uniref:Uncharacterized protein n=1 Tax=Limnospira platensis NIES-46 TaxID=1236695 RepID=A0A5M3T2Q5_LIMPL|nr:hypothetical protein [Arthrospira platensis]AMW29840.1 hypothetical protein AP285_19770 [Arthrospira platensis YZ]KDR54212.1 hypothetical protein APPUASWS_029485 [Arthrospira platensis str. Paraca]MBD2671356.1 hypothetical protein [Arthrospira platensis FACHB-439]MBD2712233.1 hypothetical protein [Arthrospira platensis FACHB-835]MDF2212153.1 hypothetical protein [Arthrospira platensis NCB002]MDT9185786.1 hypothetical protein [Limnospira sp. PMC 289.06]MDT9298029.1 hypothetical protein [Ar
MYQTFIDLDELIILCIDKSAKKFLQEAVACYRAGAYRSCIVSTWNAVVFDFIHKLRQLDQVGNGEAYQLLQQFENMSKNSDVKGLWKFESDIPNIAESKFALISPIEKADITRLCEDRSRCAHPSMASLEEPFEATAELARYHMRSAVTYLLQRPPVQGRLALNIIWEDIKSVYFPTNPNQAVQYFQKGLLARPRVSLIKDIVIGLTRSLLTEDLPEDEKERQFSALNAVARMHRENVGNILTENLSSIILDEVTDENWPKVITYLRRVDNAVENLSDPCRLKAIRFIEKMNVASGINCQDKEILANAAYIDFLMDSVQVKLKEASPDEVLNLMERLPYESNKFKVILNDSIEAFIKKFERVTSFQESLNCVDKFYPIYSFLSPTHKESILNAFCNNHQIYGSYKSPWVITNIFHEDTKNGSLLESYWLSFRKKLDEKFPDRFEDLKKLIDSYKDKF